MVATETTGADLMERVARVRSEIADATARAGRAPDSVTLIGVCKTVDRPAVDAAYAAGLRHFGENRVQDAIAKFTAPLPPDATLHLIGQLQSNKAKPAAGLFDVIESLDRPSLVNALGRAAEGREAPLPVLLQVNVAREPQKAGCSPEDAPALVEAVLASPHLALHGLMTIAPLVSNAETVRPVFAALRQLKDDLGRRYPELALPVLSMGMSNDFQVAIEEGAIYVRIGRAIFHG